MSEFLDRLNKASSFYANGDAEEGHFAEDEALWAFVEWEAKELKNPVALEMVAWLEGNRVGRERWYA